MYLTRHCHRLPDARQQAIARLLGILCVAVEFLLQRFIFQHRANDVPDGGKPRRDQRPQRTEQQRRRK